MTKSHNADSGFDVDLSPCYLRCGMSRDQVEVRTMPTWQVADLDDANFWEFFTGQILFLSLWQRHQSIDGSKLLSTPTAVAGVRFSPLFVCVSVCYSRHRIIQLDKEISHLEC